MVYTLPGGEAVLRTLPADAAIRNLPVAPRPPLPTAPIPRFPLPPVGGGAAAGGGAAGGAAATGSAAATAGAIAAGVLAFGAGFAVGDAVAQALGIEYPGGKNALQYFFGGKDPGIGATGAVSAPLNTTYEGEPAFRGGQSTVQYSIFWTRSYGTPNQQYDYLTGPLSLEIRIRSDIDCGGNGSYKEYVMKSPALNINLASGCNVTATGITVQRRDGQPDTGGDPPGQAQPGTLPRRVGAPLAYTPTAPAPAPTTTPTTTPTAPATPGDPVNPTQERDPLLPPWLDWLTVAGAAAGAAAGLTGAPAPGPGVTPVNNPSPGDAGENKKPPPPTKTDNSCRCNIPLFNKLDALDKKIERSLGPANLIADGGIMAKLNQMQGFAEKAWEKSRIQKVLNAMTLITVLHNASMVSRDVGETLGYALGQGLNVLGIEDENGESLDINGWFGKQVNSFFEDIFGAERWRGINATWNKANRIISSASAIVWTIRSINDGTQEVLEWTAENTGKIGNALKKWGVVGERAYGPMAERVKAQDAYRRKFSRILDGLDTADDAASSFAQVTSNVLEITEEVGELGEQRENFKAAVKDLAPGAYPDNSDIPTTTEEAKTNATAGPSVTAADMEPSTNGAT